MTTHKHIPTPPDDPIYWLNALAHNQQTNGNAPQSAAPLAPQPGPPLGSTPPPTPNALPGAPNNRFNSPLQQAQQTASNAQNQGKPLGRFGSGSSARPPFSNAQQLTWEILPTHKTVVRFDLRGLGDPFYRLLGQKLNPDFVDSKAVTKALELGGEAVEDLKALLDAAWESYDFQGAMLVFDKLNTKTWKGIATPSVMPNTLFNTDEFDDDDDNNQKKQATPPPPPMFTMLRSYDMQVVLNVLARARSQMLLTEAPLVFSQQYLNRSLVSDDPRLVELVRLTGCLEES